MNDPDSHHDIFIEKRSLLCGYLPIDHVILALPLLM